MAVNSGNAAEQLPDTENAEDASMEEILSSIKQIIADDEQADSAETARENFAYPDNPSNSNRTTKSPEEAELQAELQAELNSASQEPTEQELTEQAATAEDKASALHDEVSATSAGMTADERIEKYRKRNKLKIEALAEERAKQTEQSAADTSPTNTEAADAQKAETAAQSPPTSSAEKVVAPPVKAPQVSTLVAPAAKVQPPEAAAPAKTVPPLVKIPEAPSTSPAAPVAEAAEASPTSQEIARKMAEIIMLEKSDDIDVMLQDLLKPTIRQWLNDNLPTLVQRLVREEIQAASRGRKSS